MWGLAGAGVDSWESLCADHGDAFGEDGHRGHGIAHPAVWSVPYAETLLPR
jgi:hypothetical protein